MWALLKAVIRQTLKTLTVRLVRAAADYRGETTKEDRIDSVARQLLLSLLTSGATITEQDIRECVRLGTAYDAELHQPTSRPAAILKRYSDLDRGETD